jgi:hypothetical protein
MRKYMLTILSPSGAFRDMVTVDDGDVAYGVGAVGAMTITVGLDQIRESSIVVDAILLLYIVTNGIAPTLDGEHCWFLRKWVIRDTLKGKSVKMTAYDGNYLLDGRIVAYASNSAQAKKGKMPADNMIKAVVRENLGNLATDTARRWPITVEEDASLAPLVSKAFSRDIVLSIVNEICSVSTEKGTYLAFDTVWNEYAGVVFRTYISQRGINRGKGSSYPLLFSKEAGNLSETEYTEDHSDAATYIYCGGQGEDEKRMIGTADNPAWINASPWSRRERFVDARNVEYAAESQATLDDEAKTAIYDARPTRTLSGKIQETPLCQWGVHFGYGDKVVLHQGENDVDCRINAVHVTYSGNMFTLDAIISGEVA